MILSALSYCLAPLARYPPPALLLLTSSWCLVWPCPLHACSAIVFIVDVVLVSAPDSPLIRPSQILFLPPAPVLPPPPSLGLLRLFSLPRAPLPLALAADISHKDEDVGYQTGRVVTCWLVAGGSTSRGKCPNRPIAVVGDGISLPQFLHRPQQ